MQFPARLRYAGSLGYAPLVSLREGEGYTLPGDSGSHLSSAKGLPTCCTLGIASGVEERQDPGSRLGGHVFWLEINDRVKLTEASKKVLKVRFERSADDCGLRA